jgi:hypothetical protein
MTCRGSDGTGVHSLRSGGIFLTNTTSRHRRHYGNWGWRRSFSLGLARRTMVVHEEK